VPALAAVLLVAAAAAAAPEIPAPEWILEQVRILADPAMEGRASGTAGADRAAQHIARAFKAIGLVPGGDAGGYLQTFTVPTAIRLGAPNTLALAGPTPRVFVPGAEFTPLTASTDGTAEGELVFVGHGITAPDLQYDDYAGLDARGKIVLAVTGEPRAQDPASPFRKPDAYHYADRRHKVINARQHGARAILLVAHPRTPGTDLPPLRGLPAPLGIIAAGVARPAADAMLAATGRRLTDFTDAIDRALAPQSRAVPGTSVRVQVALLRERGTTANVVGLLPGTDPRLAREAIVVGAHYDHLGRGGEGSLAPDEAGAVHHGADDNASGTAAVLALARAFARAGGAPRTLVFVAFGAEEMGLLGSDHYVRRPAVPLDRTALMVNFDMVGRLRDGKIYLGGVDSGRGLREMATRAAAGLPVSLALRGDPYGPSDHMTFYAAGAPVVFVFTGAHADYHRPGDTWEKIDPAGLATVATVGARLVADAATAPAPPAYVKVEPPAAAPRGGYGAYFGIVPEFGESTRPGVRVTAVRDGSPAQRAGVQAGDVIVKFGKVEVTNLQDLTFALRGHRAGDRVDVVVDRTGIERTLPTTLGERR
jgi:hypothetical protein